MDWEKGGRKATVLQNVDNRTITNLQKITVRQFPGDLAGAFVRVFLFIVNDNVFLFLSQPVGMGMTDRGIVRKTFHFATTGVESFKVTAKGANRKTTLRVDLRDRFFPSQDGANQFIALSCIHSVASRKKIVLPTT